MVRSTTFNSFFMAEEETIQINDAGLLRSDYAVIFLTKFCASINEYARGGPEATSLIHDNLEVWDKFRIAIRRTAPNFQPFANAMGSLSDGIQDWSEEEGLKAVIQSDQKPFYLTDMRKHLQRCVLLFLLTLILLIASILTRELLNYIPFTAKSQLMMSFQQSWLRTAETCFDRVHEAMSNVIDKTILNHFRNFGNLQSHLRCVILSLVPHHYIVFNGCISLFFVVVAEPS
jgi:hypothetical protein